MAQLVADSDGKISGRFTVPPNIPVGTKLMQFVGSEGNYGEASYTARGIITTEERRRVTTLTDIRQQQTTVVVRRFRSDPLAQTFTLNQGRHIGGVDLWFTEKGTRRVIAQIRETTTGIPNQTILAEAHVQAENINLSGGHTRIEWAPVWLDAGTEYAIVILGNQLLQRYLLNIQIHFQTFYLLSTCEPGCELRTIFRALSLGKSRAHAARIYHWLGRTRGITGVRGGGSGNKKAACKMICSGSL